MTHQLASAARSVTPAPTSPRAARFSCDQPVWCFTLSAEPKEVLGHVKNISRSGMALLLSERPEPKTRLGVEFHCPEGQFSYLLVGEVVRTLPHGGSWLVGCAFDRSLGDDELTNLL